MPLDLTILSQIFQPETLLKTVTLVVILCFLVFAAVVYTQIRSMDHIVKEASASFIIKFVSLLIIFIAFSLFLIAFVIL